MNITVTIRDNEFSTAAGYSVEIGSAFERAFERIATGDVPELWLACGEMPTQMAAPMIRVRKEAAKEISNEITKVLIEHMERGDTHNGYRKHG